MNGQADFGSVNSLMRIQSAQFIRAKAISVTNEEIIHYDGRFLGLKEQNGWEFAYRTNSSGIVVMVPVTDKQELVLVEQYRIPVKSQVLELPAGLVGDAGNHDEDFETAAQRELIEETGYRAATLEKLMTCPSTAGMADEMVTIYYARSLERIGPGGGVGNENIIVHHVPLDNAVDWLDKARENGMLLDPKIYAALFWAAQRT